MPLVCNKVINKIWKSFYKVGCKYIILNRQYVGNPIDCVHTKDIPEDVLNTYCWIHSTYTIPSAFWKRIGIDVAHPGIDKTIDPEERRYVRYYQWVCFCLFFQVIIIIIIIIISRSPSVNFLR